MAIETLLKILNAWNTKCFNIYSLKFKMYEKQLDGTKIYSYRIVTTCKQLLRYEWKKEYISTRCYGCMKSWSNIQQMIALNLIR